jgi:hypothetical protein
MVFPLMVFGFERSKRTQNPATGISLLAALIPVLFYPFFSPVRIFFRFSSRLEVFMAMDLLLVFSNLLF